jgi:VanZ family protein
VALSDELRAGVAPARRKRWLSTWGGVIGYCVLIFALSSQPDLTPPAPLPLSDKPAHLLEYGILGWLWARAVRASRPGWAALAVLLSTLIFTGSYGLSDEWHQYYVPGRFADLRDVLADAFGGTLGGVGYLLWLGPRGRGQGGRAAGRVPGPRRDRYDPTP